MRPLPTVSRLTDPNVQQIAKAPLSLVRGPPGSYVAERLAAAIQGWDRWQGCVWLRAGGARPAAIAESLVSACLHRWTDDHRGDPSAVSNARLDETMRLAPAGAVVVLELGGWVTPGVARLLDGIRRVAAERDMSLVAVAESHSPTVFLRNPDCVISTAALSEPSLPADAAELSGWCSHRLRMLAGRRAAIRHDVLDASRAWPAEVIADALDRSGTLRSMLDRLTGNLLDLSSPAQLGALRTCVATGYWHPQLAAGAVQASELRPWIVPLEDEWGWLRPIWARSLERHLKGRTGHRRRPWPGDRIVGPAAPAAEPTAPQRGIVEARLLGTFEFSVDGRAVEKWTGQRGMSVLRYLLSRRRHTCSRDELLDAFWPEVAPDAARNRLQVAVSGLRRALREVTNLHVIEYAEGSYRINIELQVDVDVERFEAALSAARGAERSGDLDRALVAYREATELYRGGFASDAPYEQWTLLPRENLRITYIDALDRMSRIQLSVGRLDDCIAAGHRMLDVDPCREDAHRLLMRCYASQGRAYQAIRQYEFCCRMLKGTLEVGPAPETIRLYRAIRAGSADKSALTG
ncbi:MAG: AfsR/SARP family transcriptional regulator [Pseudonocardiaceae bacterium]